MAVRWSAGSGRLLEPLIRIIETWRPGRTKKMADSLIPESTVVKLLCTAIGALVGAIVWMARWFVSSIKSAQDREDVIHDKYREERAGFMEEIDKGRRAVLETRKEFMDFIMRHWSTENETDEPSGDSRD